MPQQPQNDEQRIAEGALTPSGDNAMEATEHHVSHSLPMANIKWLRYVRFIFPVTVTIFALLGVWLMFFLHDNVYLTLATASTLNLLKSAAQNESIHEDKLNRILQANQLKLSAANSTASSKAINPFAYGSRNLPAASSSPATTTSSTISLPLKTGTSTPIKTSSTAAKASTTVKKAK